MKSIFIILPIIVISSIPNLAQASINITKTFSWEEGNNKSGVFYKKDSNNELRTFYSSIGHSNNGQQRLYFEDYSLNIFNKKKYVQPTTAEQYLVEARNNLDHEMNKIKSPSTFVISFNGQPVKMTEYLVMQPDTQKFYKSFTPQTNSGHKYLIDLFKRSSTPIKVQYNNNIFKIPAKGFTNNWVNNGGNAI